MRNNLGSNRLRLVAHLGVVLGLTIAPAAAHADDLNGQYDVKFEPVSTNCQSPLTYPQHGTLKIDVKGSDLQVDIERTPLMVGKSNKTGKISVKSPRPGHTMLEGMDGVFSIAGRITGEGMLSLVMVGEYTHNGAPLCTQSWNLSGLRKSDGGSKPSDKPKR